VALGDRRGSVDYAGQLAFHSDRFGRNGLVLLSIEDSTLVHLTAGREHNDQHPRWSPDCRHLAYDTTAFDHRTFDVALLTLGAGPRRLTSTLHNERRPTWFRDGRSLVFEVQAAPSRTLARISLDHGVVESAVTGAGARTMAPALSPVDDTLAYIKWGATGLRLTIRRPGTPVDHPISPPGLDAADPAWSRDGRRLAYVAVSADQPTVVVTEPDAGTSTVLAAPDLVGIREPTWAPDGSALAIAVRKSTDTRWALAILELASARAYFVTDGTANDRAPDWRPCE
jgi:Tol biopolymer transport system component